MISETRDPDGLVLRVGHSADWEPEELGRALELLGVVFDDLTPEDWEHALGGTHVLASRDGQAIGHASLVQRRLLYREQALRTGYVEGVAVHPAHQRKGVGGRMMDVLEGMIRRAFELGALGASDEGAHFTASEAGCCGRVRCLP
jgi:aminoglycoside 2'-N-acetyltransferase I